jgi:gluconate 2-dehydrogenase gamma chain
MTNKNILSRRQFSKMVALGTGSILLLSRCTSSGPLWRFFTNQEAQLMNTLADQIIPPDEWPGGSESGVTNFIDKQLTGPYTRFQSPYRKGLTGIQETCSMLYQKKFEDLSFENQTTFLEMMESGKTPGTVWREGFDREFFELFRDHSMQSYYGSSRHGGNKNNTSYKMLQLDYPVIIGQNRYKS